MVRKQVNLIEDSLAEEFLIVGAGGLSAGTVVLDLESTGPDLVRDEPVSLGLRQKIFLVL